VGGFSQNFWSVDRLRTIEEVIKFCKVTRSELAHLLITGNNTMSISVWRGGGMYSNECPLVTSTLTGIGLPLLRCVVVDRNAELNVRDPLPAGVIARPNNSQPVCLLVHAERLCWQFLLIATGDLSRRRRQRACVHKFDDG